MPLPEGVIEERFLDGARVAHTEAALDLFAKVKDGLANAYELEAKHQYEQSQTYIQQVRDDMKLLRVEGEELAAKNIGIPFWPEGQA